MKEKKSSNVQIPTLEEVEAERKRIRYKRRYNRTLKSTLAVLIVVAAVSVLVATTLMPVMQSHGSSMSPTLYDGDIFVTVKTSKFQTGDIVAFWHGNKLLVKRCIAGPGQWVDIDEDGTVYVDKTEIAEPYIEEKALGQTDLDYPYQVPESRWFLMGDNRATSLDSRTTTVGCVAAEQIAGRVLFRIWPIGRIGLLH